MKLIRSRIAWVAVAGLFLGSCSKEHIELPESNDPVFVMDGTFNGESFSMAAGDDGAYMYTMTEDVNGVNLYKGYMSDASMKVEMGIFDGMIDHPVHEFLETFSNSSLTPQFAYNNQQPLVFLSKDEFTNDASILKVDWFRDGNFIGTDYAEINEPGHYMICAEITFNDSTTETLCNDMIVGYKRSSNCSIDYDIEVGNYNYLHANVINVGGVVAVSSINWYFNENLIYTGSTLSYQLGNTAGIVKAVVAFNDGSVREKSIYVNPNTFMIVEDFTMFEEVPTNDMAQDFKIRIVVEKDGETYSTYLTDNSASTFNILGLEYYGKNSSGNDVYKLKASVDAKVKSLTSANVLPIVFTTTFGIEIH